MSETKRRFKRDGDTVEVTILSDGTVRVDVQGSISYANHGNAEDVIRSVETGAGGQTEVQSHGHVHAHAHAHESHTHKH